jgi:hypothetical protein
MKLIFMALVFGNIAFFVAQWLGAAPPVEPSSSLRVMGQPLTGLQTLVEREAKAKVPNKAAPKKVPEIIRPSSSVANGMEQCQLIGPFAELLHAEYLVERLKGLEIIAFVRNIEIADGKNYWVYLKPEMSEKEALRKLYEVQAKAIDSYIIPTGELANGISFGQFSDNKAAQEQADKIRSQGYAAEIKEIPKSHSEVWVEIKEKGEQKINTEQWLDLLKEEKGIERRQNYCLSVAP